MVLLTMTATMVEALESLQQVQEKVDGEEAVQEMRAEAKQIDGNARNGNEKSTDNDQDQALKAVESPAEPSLSRPKIGGPISHGQVIDIARKLKTRRIQPKSLEALLKGSKVYIAPPLPKPEPVSDYRITLEVIIGADALLADLRIQSSHGPPSS